MNELFDKLLQVLKEHGPLSPDVAVILQEISAKFPDEAQRARDVVAIAAKQPPESESPLLSLLTSKSSVAALSVLAGGGLTFGAFSISPDQLPEPPRVTSQWALFAIVAVLGAVAGFAYSFYRNNWTVTLPTFKRSDGKFEVESFGVLRNVAMAAVVAVATAWTAMARVPVESPLNSDRDTPQTSTAAPATEDPVVRVSRSLLTWNVILSAIVAGIVGSRMTSGEVEKNTLWTALAKAVEQPPVEGLGRVVTQAKTPREAALIAENSSKEDPRVRIATEKLLELLDRSSLKEALKDKPLDNSGKGITLDVLSYMTVLQPGLRSVFKGFEIPTVASKTLEAFVAESAELGIDVIRLKSTIGNLHAKASEVMAILKSLPPNWRLDSELINV